MISVNPALRETIKDFQSFYGGFLLSPCKPQCRPQTGFLPIMLQRKLGSRGLGEGPGGHLNPTDCKAKDKYIHKKVYWSLAYSRPYCRFGV